jgi:DNA repair protein RecN (Recombination protein N)
MLVQIAIRHIVLIDRLDLEVGSGLTILTGETGAGKSILLDALSLALGARGSGSFVRDEQREGHVTAVFQVAESHPAVEAARKAGVETSGELIMRRIQYADGRTRGFINDDPVSVQTLRGIGAELVEIHGQHDDRALVDPSVHRRLVDAFGGLAKQAARTRACCLALRDLRADAAAESARLAQARTELDYLRHAHAELSELAVAAGEEAELADKRAAMLQAEKVAAELLGGRDLLSGDHSPGSALVALGKRLGRRVSQAPALVEPCVTALDAAVDAVDLAAQALEYAVREARYDARQLEQTEERLFALRAAGRKYAVRPDDLPALCEKFAADLQALEAGETRLSELEAAVAAARTDYRRAAEDLSRDRRQAAERLARSVNAELPPLKLEGAKFWAEIETDGESEGLEGFDRVEFWAQTNQGSRAGALMKVASGGELARFMLALKVVLADRGSAPTLVFDEIDTGVGGAVADAIGQRLARLADRVQVLAVTHAPQVAARAADHFRIAKDAIEGERVATHILPLSRESRREEIARMLAGASVTDEARAAARRLLEAS